MQKRTLNLGGRLEVLDTPLVMGIANLTPDSFYSKSRIQTDKEFAQRVETILEEGGRIVDIGGYSSRPGAEDISSDEERARLDPALSLIRKEYPEVAVSLDTFRADIARWAVQEYGVQIINDISGGQLDERMFETIAQLQVPYILMHMRGTPQTMQTQTSYNGGVCLEVLDYFIKRLARLVELGVHDVIIDPGFGFSKDVDQSYELLAFSGELKRILERPMLVGVSRKSMIYKPLGISPEEALNGTTVLNSFALLQGADILRVHDVREAVEAVKLVERIKAYRPEESCGKIESYDKKDFVRDDFQK